MGGHAWKSLSTPRMSRDLYLRSRAQASAALKQLFQQVVVPAEMPSKKDYGDVDFLVAGPLTKRMPAEGATADKTSGSTMNNLSGGVSGGAFDYPHHVSAIKTALNTSYGRKGFLTENVMYFAMRAPGSSEDEDAWVQIDVKVCEDPAMFGWESYQLMYASHAKMFGSMVKPLGLSMGPEGLFLRVEGLEKVNFDASLVWLTREPREVLRILGVSGKVLFGEFGSNDEVFEYLSSSWLFNPAHFAKRLKDERYLRHLNERSAPYVDFVLKWIPEHYPGYVFKDSKEPDLEKWTATTRHTLLQKVLTLYPKVSCAYYTKLAAHLKEVEEQRLHDLIKVAIPVGLDGWRPDLPQPEIIVKIEDADPQVPLLVSEASSSHSSRTASVRSSTDAYCLTSTTSTPPFSIHSDTDPILHQQADPKATPLYLAPLSRDPPAFIPRPPTASMSLDAKLVCLARWTLFDNFGNLYLAREPREKKFEMDWVSSEASDEVLVAWAREMWWAVWTRQFRVNYVGMWKKRFEKEDAKKLAEEKKNLDGGEKKDVDVGVKKEVDTVKMELDGEAKDKATADGERKMAENEKSAGLQKILARLARLNDSLLKL